MQHNPPDISGLWERLGLMRTAVQERADTIQGFAQSLPAEPAHALLRLQAEIGPGERFVEGSARSNEEGTVIYMLFAKVASPSEVDPSGLRDG